MKNVLLLLAKGFEFYEASAFIDVMGWASLEIEPSTQLYTCGLAGQVQSSFGQWLSVQRTVDGIDYGRFDALAIPGGFAEFGFYEEAYAEGFLDVIRAFHGQGKAIASICTGALPIAKSGALDGRRATTYAMNPARQAELAGFGAVVADGPIVEDGNIITSRDPSTAVDVAFLLLERLTSRAHADSIRESMGFLKR